MTANDQNQPDNIGGAAENDSSPTVPMTSDASATSAADATDTAAAPAEPAATAAPTDTANAAATPAPFWKRTWVRVTGAVAAALLLFGLGFGTGHVAGSHDGPRHEASNSDSRGGNDGPRSSDSGQGRSDSGQGQGDRGPSRGDRSDHRPSQGGHNADQGGTRRGPWSEQRQQDGGSNPAETPAPTTSPTP